MTSRRRLVLAAAAWAVFSLMLAGEHYVGSAVEGMPVTLWRTLCVQVPGWLLWTSVTPLVFRIGRRFRVELRARNIAVHLGCAIIINALFALSYTLANLPFHHEADWRYLRQAGLTFIFWSPLNMLCYWALVGIGLAIEYARRSREETLARARLATELAEAQLSALRMQLHPHFLFNTLNTIAGLVREREPERAVEMIALLGGVLRAQLRGTPALQAPLGDEVELLTQYLEIEQIRFGDRLRVTWEVDEGALELLVPQLILQPLIENALRHGLAPRTADGRLGIAARRDDGCLVLTVRDNGVGLPDGFAVERVTGVGLANVRSRLQRMYGERAGLELRGQPEGGVCATVTLPLDRAAAAAPARLARLEHADA